MQPMIEMKFGEITVTISESVIHAGEFRYTVVCDAHAADFEPVIYEGFNNVTAATLFAAERLINWEAWI